MSQMTELLQKGRERYPDLAPVFEHAIAMAREDDYLAERAMNTVMTNVSPAYPYWVQLLGAAVQAGPRHSTDRSGLAAAWDEGYAEAKFNARAWGHTDHWEGDSLNPYP